MAKITRASPGCDFSKPPGAPQFSLAVPAGAVFGGCCQLSAGAPPAPEPYTTHLDKDVSKPLTRRVGLLHFCFCLLLLSLITAVEGEKGPDHPFTEPSLPTWGLPSTLLPLPKGSTLWAWPPSDQRPRSTIRQPANPRGLGPEDPATGWISLPE